MCLYYKEKENGREIKGPEGATVKYLLYRFSTLSVFLTFGVSLNAQYLLLFMLQ